jgi:hypothetical protein
MRTTAQLLLTAALLPPALAAAQPGEVDPERIEELLRTAPVVDMEALGTGVTHSQRATLRDGSTTVQAVWKTIDEHQPIKRFYDGSPPELGFIDSYKNEIAAYELDKLLDLGLVPPTVERRIGRDTGSLQFWLDDVMTEAERFKQKLTPPDPPAWGRRLYTVRLFRQLIYDVDYRNASNVLIDEDFRIWSVDHSRGFRLDTDLLNAEFLRKFSRSLLERLEALDAELLEQALGEWLSKGQRQALLARRDLILEHARKLAAERGEDAVLFP